ncbi:MAG: AI-2E family transporter [Propioniciclava sp.]
MPSPGGIAPAGGVGLRRWWRGLRKPIATPVITSPEGTPAEAADIPEPVPPTSLLERSPFQIGFFATLGGLIAVAIVAAIGALQSVIIMIVLALFLALGLNPLVERVQRWGAPRGLAVVAVAGVLIALVSLGVWAVLPVMTEQINALVQNLPGYLLELRQNAAFADIDARFQIIDRATALITSGQWIEGFFGGILGAGAALVNVLFNVFITVILTLYFLASLPAIKKIIYELAPASRRPRARYLADQMFDRIGGYVGGLFLVVVLAGTISFVYFTIIGLSELALALAVVVMICWFIPIIGPTIATILVSIVAFSVSFPTGLAAALFLIVYMQFDAYVNQPRIFSKSVSVPGALVVVAALSGGLLFGIAGAVLAIPVAASMLLLYREVLIPTLDRS